MRTFLAPDNWIGFGTGDFVALALCGLALIALLLRRPARANAFRFAERTGWCMSVLFLLPIALRLALLPRYPTPTPSGADDFGYILLADTLRHFRLANPPHALPAFFEQIFVLQRPTYSSMFNLGQGLVLAFGWMVFGHPWAGVLVSVGTLCALCYWMLRAWTSPGWALAGGLLCVMLFGPLSYWTNCYWGGAVSAIAGCLVFGSLPRLGNARKRTAALLLGLGMALQLLTRPYEFVLLTICVMLFLSRAWPGWRIIGFAAMPLALAAVMLLFQNKHVTGSWKTLPYMLYRYDYGIPATFTFQPNPVPHLQPLNAEKELDYKAESAIHGDTPETLRSYLERLFIRVRLYRFFLFPPLYLAFAVFVIRIRTWRSIWVLMTLAVFAFGSNFYPFFYPHYIAAVACLFLLASVMGLARMGRAAEILVCLCAAQFLFWYFVYAAGTRNFIGRAAQYESWDFINYGDPQGRIAVNKALQQTQGRQLVFIHYGPDHMFQEWIHNEADIDASKVVWVHDLGPEENNKLRLYYPDRKAWVLEPDVEPPKLSPYPLQTGPFLDVP